MNPIDQIVPLIQRIYEIASELQKHTKRRFTPDGHMVGSIGEVLAAHRYGLKLARHSTEGYDAESQNGVRVQIKTTQGKKVALSSKPDHLLVLKLETNGKFDVVFNGPGKLVWKERGKKQKNGQCQIYLTKLERIMVNVPHAERLAAEHGFEP